MEFEIISDECSELGIVRGVLSQEGGIFGQREFGRDKSEKFGAYLVARGFDSRDIGQIDLGSNLVPEFVVSHPPVNGEYEFINGIIVSVVRGGTPGQAISANAAKLETQYGTTTVKEYGPYTG